MLNTELSPIHADERNQEPSYREQGCSPTLTDDVNMIARVRNYLARSIRYEHSLPVACRQFSQYYRSGQDFFYEVTK